MTNVTTYPSKKHFNYLDSARGIASLMVFTMHFYDRKYNGKMTSHILSLFCDGADAVSFFFVLSGFVLAYKYIVLKKPLDLKQFYVSRFFRLWPAFFIFLIVDCLYACQQVSAISWNNLADIFIFNKTGFWEEAFLLRFHNLYYFPGWTLTVEMVGSFLIPFFILIALKDKRLIKWLLVIFIVGIGINFCSAVHFLLGILICCYYSEINEENFRKKKWFKFRYLILFGAFVLFPIRVYDQISPFGSTYKYLANFMGIDAFIYSGLASAVFLVAILYSKSVQKVLNTKLLVFIGRISYSIYLVHPFMINVIYTNVEHAIPSKSPNVVVVSMILLYIIFTFSVATLLHYFVEVPFMRIGKRVVNRMKPSLVIVNAEAV